MPYLLSVISADLLYNLSKEVIADVKTIADFWEAISCEVFWERVIFFILVVMIVVAMGGTICLLGRSLILIAKSFARDPGSTIVENELCLLRALLQENQILLDDSSEKERIKCVLNEKYERNS
ncbi:MAG: hypothetical protein IKB53_04830 [Oscillospiraceae bacterium]|nr:hypothetical protein [Oscillospiraceae bacterium]